MQRHLLLDEVKTLMRLVDENTTTLADDIMQIDISEYTDPERFVREKRTLFRDHAQFVGPSCLIPNPGDYFTFDDTGVPILIVRNALGELNAFVNICSHRGAPLTQCASGQAKKGRLFSCPYHGWTYNLEGGLVGIPGGNEGFPGVDRQSLGLRSLQVEERYGMIFVMPNPDLRFDIEEVLGGIQERLSRFGFDDHYFLGMKKVDTAFSWKLNMDTFHEFYHFDFLHPDSIAKMAYGNIAHYRQFGRNHAMSSPSLQIKELKDLPESQWQPREYTSYVNYIFPNTVIFIVNDHFQTWRVYPVSPDQSVVYHSMFIPAAPKDAEEQQAFEDYFQMINDVAVTEDYQLVDRVHRGLSAGIPRKVMIGRNEPGVQNMHRQLNAALGV